MASPHNRSSRVNTGNSSGRPASTLPIFSFLIGVALALMNLKFPPSNNESPLETHGLVMQIFVMAILVFAQTLCNSNFPTITRNINYLSGSLAFVSLVLVLFPDLGRLFLLIWVYFVKLMYAACHKLYQLYNTTSSVSDFANQLLSLCGHRGEEIIPDSTSSDSPSTTRNHRHAILAFPIVVLLGLLPLKFHSMNIAAQFETHSVVMSIFLVTTLVDAVAWVIEATLPDDNSYLHAIIGKISLLSGSLASVLLVLVIVPPLGWLTLLVWTLFRVKLIYKTCLNLHQLYQAMSSASHTLNEVFGRGDHNNIRRNLALPV